MKTFLLIILLGVLFSLQPRLQADSDNSVLCPDEFLIYVTDVPTVGNGFIRCEDFDSFYVESHFGRFANAQKLIILE